MTSNTSKMHRPLYCGCCNAIFKSSSSDSSKGATSKIPLLLKCSHTFCEACIRKWLKGGRTDVVCPTCQQTTPVNTDELTQSLLPDVYVLGLAVLKKTNVTQSAPAMFDRVGEIIKTQNKHMATGAAGAGDAKESKDELCSECCRSEATVTCVKCESNMCKKCFDKIHQAKVLRKHKAIPLQKDMDTLTCALHDHRTMEYFCENDNSAICSRCFIVGDHKGHNVTPLEEKNKSVVGDIEPVLHDAGRFVRKARSSIKLLNAMTPEWKSELDKKISEINTHFHMLHSHLQLREQDMIRELKEVYADCTLPVQTLKQEMENDIRVYDSLIETAKRILSSPTVMTNATAVVDELEKVRTKPCFFSIPDKIEAKISFSFDDDVMKNFIARFGRIKVAETDKSYKLLTLDELTDDEDDDTESVSSLATSVEDTRSNTSETSSTAYSHLSRSPGRPDPESDDNDVVPVARKRGKKAGQIDKDQKRKTAGQAKVEQKTNDLSPPKLNLYQNEIVTVCHIKNPCHFLVHMKTDKRRLEIMSADINRWCRSLEGKRHVPTKVEPDGLYMGQFSGDNRWYRCRVKSVTETTEASRVVHSAFVNYVDFGNSETIPITRLRTMPVKFFREPEFAIKCSLVDIVPANQMGEWSEQANVNFARMTGTNDMFLVVTPPVMTRSADMLYVDLSKPPHNDITDDGPISVRDALVFLEQACLVSPHSTGSRSSTNERQFLPRELPDSGDRLNGFVCHVTDPSEFYIQTVGDEVQYLFNMSEELQTKYSSDKNDVWTIFCPLVNQICVARMPTDDQWYRARVTGLHGGRMVEVLYVDYGNAEVVSVWDVKKITDEFLILPPQALKCSLADVKPFNGIHWTGEAMMEFSPVTLHKMFVVDVKEREEDRIAVIMRAYSENQEQNINLSMVENGHALSTGAGSKRRDFSRGGTSTKRNAGQEALKRKVLEGQHALQRQADKNKEDIALSVVDEEAEGGIFYPIRVCRVVSAGEIYLQTVTAGDDGLDSLMTSLETTYRHSLVDETVDYREHQVVAALHPGENKWYRARIMDINDLKAVKVSLPDTGFDITVSVQALRELRPEMMAVPRQALPCYLDGIQPAGGGRWSATSRDLIAEAILPPKTCKVLRKGEATDESQPVDLIIEEVIPADALNAARYEHISVSRLLIEKGLALPKKSSSKPGSSTSSSPNITSETVQNETETVVNNETETVNNETDIETDNQPVDDYDDDSELNQSGSRRVPRPRVSANRKNERSTYPPTLPPIGDRLSVIPTYVDYDGFIYVQDDMVEGEEMSPLSALMEELQDEYADSPPESADRRWFVGQAVVAQYSEDRLWYRGIIMDVNTNSVKVKFVDYGNSEHMKKDRLRSECIHMTVPRLCYCCVIHKLHTASGDGVWPVAALNYMHNLVVPQHCIIRIKEPPMINKPLLVSLTLPNGEDFLVHCIDRGYALPVDIDDVTEVALTEDQVETASVASTSERLSGSRDSLVTGSRDSLDSRGSSVKRSSSHSTPDRGGVETCSQADQNSPKSQDSLSVIGKDSSQLFDDSDDGIVVRANAKSRSTGAYLTETGHRGTETLLENSRPALAVSSEEEETDADDDEDEKEEQEVEEEEAEEEEEEEVSRLSWSEIADAENRKRLERPRSVQPSRYLKLQPPDVGLYWTCGVTHILQPNLIYAQYDVSQADSMMSEDSVQIQEQLSLLIQYLDELTHLGPTLPWVREDEAEIGLPVCALYSHDNRYYRGEIVEIDDEAGVANVFFVDYGNQEMHTITDIHHIPAKYLDLPAQAMRLRLHNLQPPSGESWSKEASDAMVGAICKMGCVAQTMEMESDPPSVELYQDVPLMGEQPTYLYQSLLDAQLVRLDD